MQELKKNRSIKHRQKKKFRLKNVETKNHRRKHGTAENICTNEKMLDETQSKICSKENGWMKKCTGEKYIVHKEKCWTKICRRKMHGRKKRQKCTGEEMLKQKMHE